MKANRRQSGVLHANGKGAVAPICALLGIGPWGCLKMTVRAGRTLGRPDLASAHRLERAARKRERAQEVDRRGGKGHGAVIRYIAHHWRGLQPIPQSVALNLCFLGVVAYWGIGLGRIAWSSSLVALVGLGCAHGLLFLWQAVGVVRATDRHYLAGGNWAFAWGAYALVLLGGVAVAVSWFAMTQGYLAANEAPRAPLPSASLAYHFADGDARGDIVVSGEFGPGITRDLRAFIEARGSARRLVLDSDGGRIYEARGIAKLVRDLQLDTHVSRRCLSACTRAYLAGQRRTVSSTATLGFHGYRLVAKNVNPFIDLAAEQAIDRDFALSQGVTARFVEEAFAMEPPALWSPPTSRLISAGVVHRVANP